MDDRARLRLHIDLDTLATLHRANQVEMSVLGMSGAQPDVIASLERKNSELESKIHQIIDALHRDTEEVLQKLLADEHLRQQCRQVKYERARERLEAQREARREARSQQRKATQQQLQEQEYIRNLPVPHTRWKDWKPTEIELSNLLITEAEPQDAGLHILADEVDLRARATMTWAPWNRRNRSRRYEGWSRAS